MKLKPIETYEVPKYGYSQFIAMKDAWGFGFCKNSIGKECFIQIFRSGQIDHIQILIELLGSFPSYGQVFTISGRTCLLSEGNKFVLFDEDQTKFEVIPIKNNKKVLVNPKSHVLTRMIPTLFLA
jgi:hypothetical protein